MKNYETQEELFKDINGQNSELSKKYQVGGVVYAKGLIIPNDFNGWDVQYAEIDKEGIHPNPMRIINMVINAQ